MEGRCYPKRISEAMREARALRVPIVCSAPDRSSKVALPVLTAADYRIGSRGSGLTALGGSTISALAQRQGLLSELVDGAFDTEERALLFDVPLYANAALQPPLSRFHEIRIPVAPVNDLAALLDDPHLRARYLSRKKRRIRTLRSTETLFL